MKHVDFLVEEQSACEALRILAPAMIGDTFSYEVHPYQGKAHLLKRLPNRLKGYKAMIDSGYDCLVVVLVDQDKDDCRDLKKRLEEAARGAGLYTYSNRGPSGEYHALIWIAIEELEAWFIGDEHAITSAFPRVPATIGRRKGMRDPDSISGGTAESLERLLKRHGYHKGGLAKVDAAKSIAKHMNPVRNRSRSFCGFRDRLAAMVEARAPTRSNGR